MVSLCKSKTLFKHPMTEVLSRYPVKMKGLCRQMSSTSVIFNSRTSLFNQCINDLAIVFYFNFCLFQLIFPSQLEQSYTVQPWQRARYCMHGIQSRTVHMSVCLRFCSTLYNAAIPMSTSPLLYKRKLPGQLQVVETTMVMAAGTTSPSIKG